MLLARRMRVFLVSGHFGRALQRRDVGSYIFTGNVI
jgi:hypothetical protein